MKIKKIFKNWKVITLLIFLLFALVAIRPSPGSVGVSISSISPNSAASDAGMTGPRETASPTSKERIIEIDLGEGFQKVANQIDFYKLTADLDVNQTLNIKTSESLYRLKVQPIIEIITLNETELVTVEESKEVEETFGDGQVRLVNKTINVTKEVPKTITKVIGVEELGISITDAPKTNLRKGLDLSGGTRVLLQPEGKITDIQLQDAIDVMQRRLNSFGLSDVIVRRATDLRGSKFILVEIAGVTQQEVTELLAKQGKFEAKIGDEVVFKGGERDVTYVCRSADCSGIDPNNPCGQISEGQYACSFFFSISLSPAAAKKHADITGKLDVVSEGGSSYLSEDLDLYLDDVLVDTLRISSSLKGRETTGIQISGSGTGRTDIEARTETLKEMKRLQTVMITGSLPFKLKIVKIDTVSPALGKEFLKYSILVGILAILVVASVITIRYRKIAISLPVIVVMASEVLLTLGFAALVGWNLDLAAIAGIIIAVGTGVDDLIIITDETISGQALTSWKMKLKRAMFIIFGAYFTTLAAMIPLWFAGAGLFKGFAFITIVGVTFGVLIARPAFAAMVEILVKE